MEKYFSEPANDVSVFQIALEFSKIRIFKNSNSNSKFKIQIQISDDVIGAQ